MENVRHHADDGLVVVELPAKVDSMHQHTYILTHIYIYKYIYIDMSMC